MCLLMEVYIFQLKCLFHIEHFVFEISHAIVWYMLMVALNMPPAGGASDHTINPRIWL